MSFPTLVPAELADIGHCSHKVKEEILIFPQIKGWAWLRVWIFDVKWYGIWILCFCGLK